MFEKHKILIVSEVKKKKKEKKKIDGFEQKNMHKSQPLLI